MKSGIHNSQIAVTGTGICSAIGNSPEEVIASLQAARSGIEAFPGDGIEKMHSHWAALNRQFQLDDSFPSHLRHWWDRGTQMAASAAMQATSRSKIFESDLARNRIGLAVGVSGSGQFQPSRSMRLSADNLNFETAEILMRRNVPHFQLYQIARWLRINGPMTCICSASAGSGIAIGNAMRWLLSGRADAVVAGGGEALMLLNFLGFDTLGLLSPQPCSPFSDSQGMTMGEGAAFVVLERMEDAEARNAKILGLLEGFSVTSDAFDPILYDPSGDGIRRALEMAIHEAGLNCSNIDWIRASGAGTKEQDASEIMAIREVFGKQTPTVTSTEANFGHCNGAGPAMGFVTALESQNHALIPATLNFGSEVHAGIDFVRNVPRTDPSQHFLSVTAAFGGANVVLAGGKKETSPIPRHIDEVVITGFGSVSGLGCIGLADLLKLDHLPSQVRPVEDAALRDAGIDFAGQVKDFSFRRAVPRIPARGLDPLTQYTAAAVQKALLESSSQSQPIPSERLGVVTGLVRTSGHSLERLADEIQGPWATPTVGRTLLHKGRFLVTSRLAHWFGCKGYNSTHSGGIGVGQVALNQAVEQLRQSNEIDAIVVVASDELSPIYIRLARQLGWIRSESTGEGMTLGEGSVAVVVERRSSAMRRGARIYANLGATCCSLDSITREAAFQPHLETGFEMQSDGRELEAAIRNGLYRNQLEAGSIDLALGCPYGIPMVDQREFHVVEQVFGRSIGYGSSNSIFGMAHSASPLFNLFLATACLQSEEMARRINTSIGMRTAETLDRIRNAILVATSEDGHNVVTIVQGADQP